MPWVDVATGSLGQGLPVGVGIWLAGQYLDRMPFHVRVLASVVLSVLIRFFRR